MANIYDMSDTWNDSGTTFTAIKMDVTDSASDAASLLMDLQVGGASKFGVRKDGRLLVGAGSIYDAGSGQIRIGNTSTPFVQIGLATIRTQIPLGFTANVSSSLEDVILARDAANTLAQRNSTNAQESRLYGTYTSATAYQRLSVKSIKEAVTAASGASVTTTISIPKYSQLIGVTTRVTTDIGNSNGTTGYTVGDGSDADLWGDITGITAGTTSDAADFTAAGALGTATADRTITLTATGGNFDGTGVIEVCAFYLRAESD